MTRTGRTKSRARQIANGPGLIGVGGPARGLYRLVGIQSPLAKEISLSIGRWSTVSLQ